jgi:integrase
VRERGAERFQELIAGNRLEAMWWVFLSTGLRVGELAALQWRDVDTGTGEVTVERRR